MTWILGVLAVGLVLASVIFGGVGGIAAIAIVAVVVAALVLLNRTKRAAA